MVKAQTRKREREHGLVLFFVFWFYLPWIGFVLNFPYIRPSDQHSLKSFGLKNAPTIWAKSMSLYYYYYYYYYYWDTWDFFSLIKKKKKKKDIHEKRLGSLNWFLIDNKSIYLKLVETGDQIIYKLKWKVENLPIKQVIIDYYFLKIC